MDQIPEQGSLCLANLSLVKDVTGAPFLSAFLLKAAIIEMRD